MDRRRRLILTAGLIAILAGTMFLGAEPEVDMTVDELMSDPSKMEGESFRIHGAIVEQSIDSENGTLTLIGDNLTVTVDYAATPLPAGATDGKTISVRGEFDRHDGEWTMLATEIKTGCPSKYEAEQES